MSKETPWRNGYWFNPDTPSMVCIVDGEKMEVKTLIALDYPDLGGGFESTIIPGDFGETRKEIAEVTNADRYNVQISWFMTYNADGVINDSGTEIQQWNEHENKIDVLKWLTPDKVEELKEDRDDVNTPR